MGSQILIADATGKNFHQIGDRHPGVLFLLIPGLLLIAAFKLGLTGVLMRLFQSENISEAVSGYLDWRVYGFVFAFANSTFRAFYIGIARTKVLTINSLVMAVVNLVLSIMD